MQANYRHGTTGHLHGLQANPTIIYTSAEVATPHLRLEIRVYPKLSPLSS